MEAAVVAVGAVPLLVSAAILAAFGAGFVLGVALGVKEEQENAERRALRRLRENRVVRYEDARRPS